MVWNLDVFAEWLRHTTISEAIRFTPWLWPVCEIVHFFGLSLLVGIVGFFDARLFGFMKQVPLSAAWSLMPWAKFGFALSALTGVTFFAGALEQYVNNAAFLGKLVFLAIAGLNAAFFETIYTAPARRRSRRPRLHRARSRLLPSSRSCRGSSSSPGGGCSFIGNAF